MKVNFIQFLKRKLNIFRTGKTINKVLKNLHAREKYRASRTTVFELVERSKKVITKIGGSFKSWMHRKKFSPSKIGSAIDAF